MPQAACTAPAAPPCPRAALVRDHLPLVQHAVNRVAGRVPRHVPADDLVSAGMLGLAEAARSFDPSRCVPFDAYASTRIRGAVLDELRGMDWATRSVRSKARMVEERTAALAVELGRTPSPEEVGRQLGLAPADLDRIAEDVHRAVVVHYDAVVGDGEVDSFLPCRSETPDEVVLERERRATLRAAVAALPERLRLVVEGYFLEERLMQDVADELGVTESRVSQMRSEALNLLRAAMLAQLDPELLGEHPTGPRQARRLAAYHDAVARALQPRPVAA